MIYQIINLVKQRILIMISHLIMLKITMIIFKNKKNKMIKNNIIIYNKKSKQILEI